MEQPQSSSISRKMLWGVAVAAFAAGFVLGLVVGKKWDDPHAPELPCPSCRIEHVPGINRCELVGQIDLAWPVAKSPLVLMAPFAGGASDMLEPGDCFRIPVACPGEEGATLQFKHHWSTLLFENAWCSSGCLEKMTCSP